jgi:hypothetical protein
MWMTTDDRSDGGEVAHDDVIAIAAALCDLRRAARCCCGVAGAPIVDQRGAPAVATVGGARRRSRSRARHRALPVSRRFVLPAVHLIEPAQGREVVDLIIADGRIADAVAPGSTLPAGHDVLDAYRGWYVLPALIDMHGHLPPDNVLRLTGLFLLLHLAHGVTTVRDAGDIDGTGVPAARHGIADGRFLGPRIIESGPFVTRGVPRWPNSIVLGDDLAGIAAGIRASGARCVKLYEYLTVPDITELERQAAEHGLLTLGHVPVTLGIDEAPLRDAQHFFGVPPPGSLPREHIIERMLHWDAVDDARMDAVIRSMCATGRANTPTLVAEVTSSGAGAEHAGWLPSFYSEIVWHPRHGLPAYRNPEPHRDDRVRRARAKKLELTGRLFRAGAPLRLGTDIQQPFVVPGASLHREMELFVEAGVPLTEVWRLATREAALALGEPELGTTRTGAQAELLVCERDPTADLAALHTLGAVVHRGALLRRADLIDEARGDVAARNTGFARISAAVLARIVMWDLARRFTT